MARKLIYPKGYNPDSYYHNPKIEVRKSKLHGVGVFAKKAIKRNEVLEENHFILIKGDWHRLPRLVQEYIFGWTKIMPDAKSKAALVFGTGPLYNSSPKPTADWQTSVKRKRFIYFAIKDIKAGEEILIDYGPEYWESRSVKHKNH
ncbi:MAG TPA: SET domain-containing protein-lysine N-methyltransferase [Bacteroidia bacterium]|jgi:SET domain-containing protein|nr:SET domain-containing protein-lysine N-methyltransferase [Bacteroidia bacterium]